MESISQQVETALSLTSGKIQAKEDEVKEANDEPDAPQAPSEASISQAANPSIDVETNKQALGTFLSFSFTGSLECGQFDKCNDIYIKYSIRAGADWILATGADLGITQIARCKVDDSNRRRFVWNHPISLSYRSYNFFGWPQIILSVYYFDLFGSDQLLGYGCAHLPVSSQAHTSQPIQSKQMIKIYSPQPTSFGKQLISWITREKPKLIDSSLFGRGDLRSSIQMLYVGQVELCVSLISKDVSKNGYRNHS